MIIFLIFVNIFTHHLLSVIYMFLRIAKFGDLNGFGTHWLRPLTIIHLKMKENMS